MNELIEQAQALSKSLEKEAESEINFCNDVGQILEQYSWEVYRMSNNLKELKQFLMGN